jgi:5,10-methylene-tetrahydrofolate dehydrogenase/methenyl tetrahydrofolate cyclohydrolase
VDLRIGVEPVDQVQQLRLGGALGQVMVEGLDPDANRLIQRIDPRKDVDGFHAENVGRLSQGQEAFVPCTPNGVMEMLKSIEAPLRGAEAVVIGRSNIVGKPMAMLLTAAGATVTVCHSGTRDLNFHTRRADILVAAIGKPRFVTGDNREEYTRRVGEFVGRYIGGRPE